uniref:Uncharacterized protein n=1 Tax=Arundo donax TaxID=35708 RepID=A0A0A9CT07_ARUDO
MQFELLMMGRKKNSGSTATARIQDKKKTLFIRKRSLSWGSNILFLNDLRSSAKAVLGAPDVSDCLSDLSLPEPFRSPDKNDLIPLNEP